MRQAQKLQMKDRPKSTKVYSSDGINNRGMRPVTSKARGASGKQPQHDMKKLYQSYTNLNPMKRLEKFMSNKPLH